MTLNRLSVGHSIVDGFRIRCAVAGPRYQRGERTRSARTAQGDLVAVPPRCGENAGEDVARTSGIDGHHPRCWYVEALVVTEIAGTVPASCDHEMRYGPVPFTCLRLIDHDDVGE